MLLQFLMAHMFNDTVAQSWNQLFYSGQAKKLDWITMYWNAMV